MTIIETAHLTKQYQYFEKAEGLKGSVKSLFHREMKIRDALTDFTASIDEGEFVGLMGPNGAGKTTLIKMLTGIIQPTAGTILVNGFTPAKREKAFQKSFAVVMGQKSQLWWDLPANDSLLLNQAIYEIPQKQYRDNVAYFTKLFEVERYLSVPIRKLSLGERMKFELIASILHQPKLLFLDEPTIGLDAVAQRQIRQMLKTAGQERGITLLLTSHYTEDLIDLTKRCIVLRDGQKLYDGDLHRLLTEQSVYDTISVTFSSEKKPIKQIQQATILSQDSHTLCIRTLKQQVECCLKQLLELSDIEDIKIADEDVTLLVERIYAQK